MRPLICLQSEAKRVRSLGARHTEADVLVGCSGGSGLADGDVEGRVHVDTVEEGILVGALEAFHLRKRERCGEPGLALAPNEVSVGPRRAPAPHGRSVGEHIAYTATRIQITAVPPLVNIFTTS